MDKKEKIVSSLQKIDKELHSTLSLMTAEKELSTKSQIELKKADVAILDSGKNLVMVFVVVLLTSIGLILSSIPLADSSIPFGKVYSPLLSVVTIILAVVFSNHYLFVLPKNRLIVQNELRDLLLTRDSEEKAEEVNRKRT